MGNYVKSFIDQILVSKLGMTLTEDLILKIIKLTCNVDSKRKALNLDYDKNLIKLIKLSKFEINQELEIHNSKVLTAVMIFHLAPS